MEVKFYDNADDSLLSFAVIVAKYEDQWVFCKHKDRETYEVPGGHREAGEDILATAKRELYEETGAAEYEIMPVSIYSVRNDTGTQKSYEETFGMLYYADIHRFDELPEYEIEKIIIQEEYPEQWTYPLIQPFLMEKILQVIG